VDVDFNPYQGGSDMQGRKSKQLRRMTRSWFSGRNRQQPIKPAPAANLHYAAGVLCDLLEPRVLLSATITGNVFNDLGGSLGVKDGNDSGIAGVSVKIFNDANSNGLLDSAGPVAWINEIHYDNDGTDTGEGVEIAGVAGTNLTGWSVVAYNGSGGSSYNTQILSSSVSIDNEGSGFGAVWVNIAGLQNGAPDGVALVDASQNVIEFLSYEGQFTAVGGPANGMQSTNILVVETDDPPLNQSLQRIGTASGPAGFSWTGPVAQSPGSLNSGQTVTSGSSGDTLLGTATTNFDGSYSFTVNPTTDSSNDYLVTPVATSLPAGATLSGLGVKVVADLADAGTGAADFAYTFASGSNAIGDFVGEDTDNSGTLTAGDLGVANITVRLFASDGDSDFESGTQVTASDLAITAVADVQLSGGVPKAVELTAIHNIADLSVYELVLGSNGGTANAGSGFTLPQVALNAGDTFYITRADDDPAGVAPSAFEAFFGFAPNATSGEINHNGDDTYVLYKKNGTVSEVADVFGDVGVDGTGTTWEYTDGWAYRNDNTGPDSTFSLANWTFSGVSALAGATTNAGALNPVPVDSFDYTSPIVGDDLFIASTTTDAGGFYSFEGLANGDYWIQIDDLSSGATDRILIGNQLYHTTVLNGAYDGNADFLFSRQNGTAQVGGFVFLDPEADGLDAKNSEALGGAIVYLDINQNKQYDTGTDIVSELGPTTGGMIDYGDGFYYFGNLPAGTYHVMVQPVAGYFQSLPTSNPYWSVTVDVGEYVSGDPTTGQGQYLNFGFTPEPSAITVTGNVFSDDGGTSGTPNDGILDAGEPGIPDATVDLYVDADGLSSFNPSSGAWINELHYDNDGTDAGEGVEIVAPIGFNLAGWTLQFYNGDGGFVYGSFNLNALSLSASGSGGFGFGFAPLEGMQNGPDGIALVDPNNQVVEFLSYEGVVIATNGAARGMTSTNIGVAESASTAVGDSLQRIGSGNTAGDFDTWIAGVATLGAENTAAGQTTTTALTGGDYRIATTTTDANGDYSFGDTLPETAVWVVVNDRIAPLSASTPTSPAAVSQTLNETTNPAPVVNFGFEYIASPASIGDLVYSDVDGNGVFDGSDVGVDGVTVTLTPDGGDGILGIPKSVISQQSFESGTGYSLTGAGDDGAFAFFGVYDKNSDAVTLNSARDGYVRTNTNPPGDANAIDGNFFIVAQDTNGFAGGIAPVTVVLDPVSITGISDLEISGFFGAEYSESFNNFDAGDGINIFATIDSGTRTLVGSFVRNGDGLLVMDANLSGSADADEIFTLDFALGEFSFPVAGSGSSLVIEVELTTTDSFETIALDNLRVLGNDPLNPQTSDDGTPVQVVTSGGGLYSFTDLDPGSYFVAVDAAGLLAGYTPTTASPILVSVISGQNLETADFGFQAPPVPPSNYIAGQVFDSGTDVGIDGVTVDLYLDHNNNGVIDSEVAVGGPVLISGIIDGAGSTPKGIEIYVAADGTDLNGWKIQVEANGGTTLSWGDAFNFSDFNSGIFNKGYYYITSTVADMIALLSTATAANTIEDASFNQNGNDAFRIVDAATTIVDIFGDPAQVADSADHAAAWDYEDSYAYRNVTTGPSATFNINDWTIGAEHALASDNSAAVNVFGRLSGGDVRLAATTTSGGGLYQFNDLNVGAHYIVDVDETDSDLGTNDTLTDGVDPAPVTLVTGSAGVADFGFDEGVVAVPPSVVDFLVGSSGWAAGFRSAISSAGLGDAGGFYRVPTTGNQLKTLPWTNLNQLRIVFSEDVNIGLSDLVITSLSHGNLTPSSVSSTIDGLGREIVTFTFTGLNLLNERLQVHVNDATVTSVASGQALDGEFTTNGDLTGVGSGDGISGGDFRFRFNILAGDVNQSGRLEASDVPILTAGFNSVPGSAKYSLFADFNGSARIEASDIPTFTTRFNTALAVGTPQAYDFGD
jgi:hypothetical protein